MSIHFIYTDILLQLQLVHEVHVWDFTPIADDYNSNYLNKFLQNSTLHGYKLFRRPSFDNNPNGLLNNGYLYQSYYSHYATNLRYSIEDIIIKADDDIVYLDIPHFNTFISNISISNIYFPNILNNDVNFIIQAKRNIHPSFVMLLEAYEIIGIDLEKKINQYMMNKKDIRYLNRFPPPVTALHPGTWRGGIYANGIAAKILHDVFLENPLLFSKKSYLNHTRFVEVARRISINMFALRVSMFREVFSLFLTPKFCCVDEGYVGDWPSITRKKHLVDTKFTVVHFAYGIQRMTYSGNIHEDLNKYATLANAIKHLFNV